MLLGRVALPFVLLVVLVSHGSIAMAGPRWSEAQAREWYAPSGVSGRRQLRARHRDQRTRDVAGGHVRSCPHRSRTGLGGGIGMNTMRVFLHDLAYQQDPTGIPAARIDQFLTIAAEAPHPPDARAVRFGVGSRFRRSGRSGLRGPACTTPAGCRAPARWRWRIPSHWPRLEAYVTGVIGRFKDDPRVLAWDLWNEVDNHQRARLLEPRAEEQG